MLLIQSLYNILPFFHHVFGNLDTTFHHVFDLDTILTQCILFSVASCVC